MQLHQIKRIHKNKKSRQVGRGGKRGKTSGRGTKGQNARAGHKKRPELRDIIKKLPKLRGYAFKSFRNKPVILNLDQIESRLDDGSKITPQFLLEKGMIKKIAGKMPKVKILASGEVSKKFVIDGCLISESAKIKIEKAGGSIVGKVEKTKAK